MYANQIIDSISTIDAKSFEFSKSFIINSLTSSVKFHLGELTESVDNLLLKFEGTKLFDNIELPYPCILLTYSDLQDYIDESKYEKSTKRGILAIQKSKDYIIILPFSFFDAKQLWITPLYGIEFHRDYSLKVFNVIKNEELIRRAGKLLSDDELRDYCKQIQSEASILSVFLILLHCKNIVPETIFSPTKLNKSRARKGKLPLFEYKVLNISLPGDANTTHSTGHNSLGESQRVHLCRGHFKNFTKERPLFGKHVGRYWWQPIVRGNGNGIITKDYAVAIDDKE